MRRRPRRIAGGLAAVAALMVAAACSSAAAPADPSAPVTAGPRSVSAFTVPAGAGHVHAIAKDPVTRKLLLATHGGLYAEGAGSFERVGPVIDLMGFTVAGPNHYYASGHPQPGTDLPEPVGLIESVDGGRTWQVLSRGGESDFHALTMAGSGVAGFDGTLRRTDDGTSWEDVALETEPISMTGRAGDRRVVASSREAVLVSEDAGRTWRPVSGSPAPALVSRADNAVVAVTADGRIHLADASGKAWKELGLSVAGPQALLATGSSAELEIVVLTDEGLQVSRAGAPFGPWTPEA